MSVYLILLIVTAGAPIERAYEFESEVACREAVGQVQAAYKGKAEKPVVFCSPSATPFNPGRVAPVAPSGVKLEVRRGKA